MEQPPPLSQEEINQLASQQYAQLGEPQPVKVLGIFHVIFGAIGALGSLWTIYVIVMGNPFLKMAGDNPGVDFQRKLEESTKVYTVIGTAFSVLVTALILTAGIQLLKKRKTALKWSNAYAWSSIGTKVLNLILSFIIVVPMTQKMMSEISGGAAAPPIPGFGGIMYASMFGGFLFSIIYPVITLILLNRPNVKQWFANQPD